MEGGGLRVGGCKIYRGRSLPVRYRPSLLYNTGTKHVGFASTRPYRGGGGGVMIVSCMVVVLGRRPSHSFSAGTDHVGFSPTRQTLLAPGAKRREVLCASHEG